MSLCPHAWDPLQRHCDKKNSISTPFLSELSMALNMQANSLQCEGLPKVKTQCRACTKGIQAEALLDAFILVSGLSGLYKTTAGFHQPLRTLSAVLKVPNMQSTVMAHALVELQLISKRHVSDCLQPCKAGPSDQTSQTSFALCRFCLGVIH